MLSGQVYWLTTVPNTIQFLVTFTKHTTISATETTSAYFTIAVIYGV